MTPMEAARLVGQASLAPAVGPTNRTSRIYRIAELISRYRAQRDGDKWRFVDLETGKLSVAEYSDEDTARAGARLAAACDIHALFDGPPR